MIYLSTFWPSGPAGGESIQSRSSWERCSCFFKLIQDAARLLFASFLVSAVFSAASSGLGHAPTSYKSTYAFQSTSALGNGTATLAVRPLRPGSMLLPANTATAPYKTGAVLAQPDLPIVRTPLSRHNSTRSKRKMVPAISPCGPRMERDAAKHIPLTAAGLVTEATGADDDVEGMHPQNALVDAGTALPVIITSDSITLDNLAAALVPTLPHTGSILPGAVPNSTSVLPAASAVVSGVAGAPGSLTFNITANVPVPGSVVGAGVGADGAPNMMATVNVTISVRLPPVAGVVLARPIPNATSADARAGGLNGAQSELSMAPRSLVENQAREEAANSASLQKDKIGMPGGGRGLLTEQQAREEAANSASLQKDKIGMPGGGRGLLTEQQAREEAANSASLQKDKIGMPGGGRGRLLVGGGAVNATSAGAATTAAVPCLLPGGGRGLLTEQQAREEAANSASLQKDKIGMPGGGRGLLTEQQAREEAANSASLQKDKIGMPGGGRGLLTEQQAREEAANSASLQKDKIGMPGGGRGRLLVGGGAVNATSAEAATTPAAPRLLPGGGRGLLTEQQAREEAANSASLQKDKIGMPGGGRLHVAPHITRVGRTHTRPVRVLPHRQQADEHRAAASRVK